MGKSEILVTGEVQAVGEYEMGIHSQGWRSVIVWIFNQDTLALTVTLEIWWFSKFQV